MKYYIFAFTILGLLAFAYRTLIGHIVIRKYHYYVNAVGVEGGNVVDILLSPSTTRQMSFKPGQFVFVRFVGARDLGLSREWHPFSISSSPHEAGIRISAKGLGDYTNKLTSLLAGTKCEIEGAYGRFSYINFKNKHQIWVAGGIGVTPFLSMARSITGSDYHVDLYYSVKTASELIDWRALEEVARLQQGRFRVFPYVGDQQSGHLTADYIEKMSGGLHGKEIFICGPQSMMKGLRQQLRSKGLPGTSIHSEEFAMS